MSALPPKADMCSHELDVCFVPKSGLAAATLFELSHQPWIISLGQHQLALVCARGEGVRHLLVEIGAAATDALVFAGAVRELVRICLQLRTLLPGFMLPVLWHHPIVCFDITYLDEKWRADLTQTLTDALGLPPKRPRGLANPMWPDQCKLCCFEQPGFVAL